LLSLPPNTIRGIPAEVDRALRVKAAQRKQSLNRVVLDELSRALLGKPVKADFTELVGKWEPDPGFAAMIASQRQIDADKWKSGLLSTRTG
jgi:plasmid stability protein